jgi:hypothetical protein
MIDFANKAITLDNHCSTSEYFEPEMNLSTTETTRPDTLATLNLCSRTQPPWSSMLPKDLKEKIEWKKKKEEETTNATTVGKAATTLPAAQ